MLCWRCMQLALELTHCLVAIPTVVPFSPGERVRVPAAFVGVVESAKATKQCVSSSTVQLRASPAQIAPPSRFSVGLH